MIVKVYKHWHEGVFTGETLVFTDYDKTNDPVAVVSVPEGSRTFGPEIIFPGGGRMFAGELIKHAESGEFGLMLIRE